MRPSLTHLLSLNAGYVDTAGFLALSGLFTSHVTGNFVTLAASLVAGTSGTIAKTLALPMFCLMVIVARLIGNRLRNSTVPVLRTILTLQLLLLAAGAVLAVSFGPFADADHLMAVITGLVLVAAMAIQNAAHRVHLQKAPPSTVMTMTVTQMMLDVADVLGEMQPLSASSARQRLRRMGTSALMFALGCAGAALAFLRLGVWCFVFPVLLTLAAVLLRETRAPEAHGY